MKAFVVTQYKQPVVEAEVAEPVVGDGDVLIRVEAAGLNKVDELIRLGVFRQTLPYRLPVILGNDVAGTVIQVGRDVRAFQPGDTVYARPHQNRIGAFAERIAVAEQDLAPILSSITMEQAGSLPLVALTAWQALVEKGTLQEGQKVLIHGGAGGVGSIAIQLAHHLGATVATTASAANHEFVRELGADIVIDHRTQDFAALLADYDLVLDSVGGDSIEKSFAVLKRGGRVVAIAGVPEPGFARENGLKPIVRLAIRAISAKVRRAARRRGVGYDFLFVRADGQQLRQISELVESGAIRPIVSKVFPFDQTLEALEWLKTARIRGKAVISNP